MGQSSGVAAGASVSTAHGARSVRLGILGCGAVVERLHLPAARRVEGLEVAALVDRDAGRARELATRFGVPDARTDFEGLDGRIDAALIALPNHLHAPVAIDLLKRGIAVLVEKPMALSVADARAMVEAAVAAGVTLQVGLMKRFARGATLIREAIEQGLLGDVVGFSVEWGPRFHWPVTTDSGLNPSLAGGGVLTDFGSHFLDLLCWWFGEPTAVEYEDDSRGGVEADCEVTLTLSGAAGTVAGVARFSRIREFRNTVRIVGERLTIEWDHEIPDAVRVEPTAWSGPPPSLVYGGVGRQSFEDLFVAQLRAFAASVATGGPTAVSGESVVPSVALIERCYRQRKQRVHPWERPMLLPEPLLVGR